MSALEWKGAPGNIIARGEHGLYTIQSLITDHILQAVEGDAARAVLGRLGKSFHSLDAAKQYASELDGGK